MPIITTSDYIPKLESAGLSATIESLAGQMLELGAFVEALNDAIKPMPEINIPMLLTYISDTMSAGRLSSLIIVSDAPVPNPVEHGESPAGFGQDDTGVWFSTPAAGIMDVLWYINGTLKLRQAGVDLSAVRYATKIELDCKKNDVIQVATVYNNVVSWFGKVTVS